jgi:hypothetical protein
MTSLQWTSALRLVTALSLAACASERRGAEAEPAAARASCTDTACSCEGFTWPTPLEPQSVPPSGAWKDQLRLPEEPFLAYGQSPGSPRWGKFTILLRDPSRVYFQDVNRHPFHLQFVSSELGERFAGIDQREFARLALRAEGQELAVGAVLYGSDDTVGIQFEREEGYHPEMVARLFALVKANIAAPPGTRFVYMPTFAQRPAARRSEGCLLQHGITVDSPARWSTGDSCYSHGWAVGRLVQVAAAEIDDAYADGRLGPDDILLTDEVPAEVPPLAGIVSMVPATPSSHVALLAQTFGVPFVHLQHGEQLPALVGREVALRARTTGALAGMGESCEARLVDLSGQLDQAVRDQLAVLRQRGRPRIPARERLGRLSTPVADLTPADIRFVGGKAANFGLLRRGVPDNSPAEAIAFTFDLWEQFLAQPHGDTTLGEYIRGHLAGHRYPPAIGRLRGELEQIREAIEEASFTAAQRTAILAALQGFAPHRKIRFRSSTNVEDSDLFTGAGLYDSYSGCLADDLDADEQGPSHCDPEERKERGVLRAIRKVYASFYNQNAFLERLRWGLDESQVGMGVLVHYSFPDRDELANGVATLEVTSERGRALQLVSQPGAASVTNPDGSAAPEVVSGLAFAIAEPFYLTLTHSSDLVVLGGHVMEWPADYEALAALLVAVEQEFRRHHPDRHSYKLDFEYKKVASGQLVVKQVRPVPLASSAATETPVLLGGQRALCVQQGEQMDVFAMHRLKSRWRLVQPSAPLTADRLRAPLFAGVEVDHLDDGAVVHLAGSLAELPRAEHESVVRDGHADLVDRFALAGGRTIGLRQTVPARTSAERTPLVFSDEIDLSLAIEYDTPVPFLLDGALQSRSAEAVALTSRCARADFPLHLPTSADLSTAGGVELHVDYALSLMGGPFDKTAPLAWFDGTRISGLTSEPLRLASEWSQSFRPGHHNFYADFLFEPALDPAVSAAQRDELRARNIRQIFASTAAPDTVYAIGFDGTLRRLE